MADRQTHSEYLGEISALCFLHFPSHLSLIPLIVAGMGSKMLFYDVEAGKLMKSFQVFQGIRIHGVACDFVCSLEGLSSMMILFRIVTFGERRVKLFNFHIEIWLGTRNHPVMNVDCDLIDSIPQFSHWVLDISFFKINGLLSHGHGSNCLAIGCTNNSIHLWDISRSSLITVVEFPERCLLYSMRLWGDNLSDMRIASGTIHNEIIVWKVVPQHGSASSMEDHRPLGDSLLSISNSFNLGFEQLKPIHICKLVGHEGSIFRLAWSSDGSRLVSISDDRSGRIWVVGVEQKHYASKVQVSADSILFGHRARIWDCCISGSLIVTAGEDCTCHLWGLDGRELKMINEHIGRGVWRCLLDLNFSLLITAGFDSAIKVHHLPASFSKRLDEQIYSFIDQTDIFDSLIPYSSLNNGPMDSKSEYVRCLHFTRDDVIYVATNHGYLYLASFSVSKNGKWTRLAQVREGVPIVCMDLLSKKLAEISSGVDDWVALGDGKGCMTIVRILGDISHPVVKFSVNWSAGKERQLLGAYWCKTLGCRFIFTADPRGSLMLWRLHYASLLDSQCHFNASLVLEYASCFGIRIMCLVASFDDEVLLCGDLRGNLILFPLSRSLLEDKSFVSERKTFPQCYFKGVHGISRVSSISVAKSCPSMIEICSTGGDGCICYTKYDHDRNHMEFAGMKQVKQLSIIVSLSANNYLCGRMRNFYAVGFHSTNFIIWNLTTDMKVVQIPCGGWRRPHCYYVGHMPESTCFAFVKDARIYIHRLQALENEREILSHTLHIQFHGREIHSLCFLSKNMHLEPKGKLDYSVNACWIATGCEDGTVRLTRYIPGVEDGFTSKLIGEHVSGSSVRSICCVSHFHAVDSDVAEMAYLKSKQFDFAYQSDSFLLISVGAKQVLTSWLITEPCLGNKQDLIFEQEKDNIGNNSPSSSIDFFTSSKWLSTNKPSKITDVRIKKSVSCMKGNGKFSSLLESRENESDTFLAEKYDDWRYLAVTAFAVNCLGSGLAICFVVVACSDATLVLKGFVFPHILWFDIALLVTVSAPVLSLQHIVIPSNLISEKRTPFGNVYIVIGGATDGSLAFWDVTNSVQTFIQWFSDLDMGKMTSSCERPQTGRGSQGGRQKWWSSSSGKLNNYSSSAKLETEIIDFSLGICEIWPLEIIRKVHQSGINCLHISYMQDSQTYDNFMFCIVTGGDDQAINCFMFCLSLFRKEKDLVIKNDFVNLFTRAEDLDDSVDCCQNTFNKYMIRCLFHEKISSAHASAIKGMWTDGNWVFSAGLDQRVRCWLMQDNCKLSEQAHMIINVTEPESLDARISGRNKYQIAVAGRGMQVLDFAP